MRNIFVRNDRIEYFFERIILNDEVKCHNQNQYQRKQPAKKTGNGRKHARNDRAHTARRANRLPPGTFAQRKKLLHLLDAGHNALPCFIFLHPLPEVVKILNQLRKVMRYNRSEQKKREADNAKENNVNEKDGQKPRNFSLVKPARKWMDQGGQNQCDKKQKKNIPHQKKNIDK